MWRYICIIWDDNSLRQRDQAKAIINRRLVEAEWISAAMQPGLVLLVRVPQKATRCVKLPNDAGVILGELFERVHHEGEVPKLKHHIETSECLRIVESGGKRLIENFEGHYVAFIANPKLQVVYVVRDPTGGLPCYRAHHQDMIVYFSEVGDYENISLGFSINKGFLAARLVSWMLPSAETGLNEVQEVLGGQCDVVQPSTIQSVIYWDPSKFIKHPVQDPALAVSRLRSAVLSAVRSRASQVDHLMLLLSGGVDSSIVLASLRQMPNRPRITCLTQYSSYHAGDERQYAEAAVKTIPGCNWITQPSNDKASFESMLGANVGPRPESYYGCLNERKIADAVRATDADVLWNGSGGDAIFFEHNEGATADFLSQRGLRFSILPVLKNEAALRRVSASRIIREVLTERLLGLHWSPFDEGRQYVKLASDQVFEWIDSNTERYIHPWMHTIERIPRGKRWHIYIMCHSMFAGRHLRMPGDTLEYSPLVNQRIMEECLAIPTYFHIRGGRTRSIAREAFSTDLPAINRDRRTKGDTREYTASVWRNNRALVRDTLLGGFLVQEGLVNEQQLEIALRDMPNSFSPVELIMLFGFEIWCRRWQGSSRRILGASTSARSCRSSAAASRC